MIAKYMLAAGLIAIGILATPQATSVAALPQTRLPVADVDTSVVQQVRHYRRYRFARLHHHRFARVHRHRYIYGYYGGGRSYCSAWRYNCAARWGWQTRRFYRCLWAHGC